MRSASLGRYQPGRRASRRALSRNGRFHQELAGLASRCRQLPAPSAPSAVTCRPFIEPAAFAS